MCAHFCGTLLHASVFATPRELAVMPAGLRERDATPSSARGGTHERRRLEAAEPLRILLPRGASR